MSNNQRRVQPQVPNYNSLLDFEKYLISKHLGDKVWTVEIRDIKTELIWSQDEHKKVPEAVVYFKGLPWRQGLVLSKTNRRTLDSIFGVSRFADLRGKWVQIKAEPVEEFGETKRPIHIFPAPAQSEESRKKQERALRETALADLRSEWKQLGGTPNPLTIKQVSAFTDSELEAEIGMAEEQVRVLRDALALKSNAPEQTEPDVDVRVTETTPLPF